MPAGTFLVYAFAKLVVGLLFRVPFRTRITGRDQVPARGGLLLVANHISFADPLLLGHALPRPVDFMAMAELFRKPVLRWIARRLRAFPVDRQRVDTRAVREAVRRLHAGHAVVIFPEGGIRLGPRSVLGGDPDLKPGASVIAELGHGPILPVIVTNTRLTYDWRNWFRRPWLTVTFGAPFCIWLPPHLRGAERRDRAGTIIREQLLATAAARQAARAG